ncbi:MAG TPA: DEAD/DEAH box helicase [Pirellulales bacterium]|nr:DEAD/DEAH box helicase [Pirellulales bacterium]
MLDACREAAVSGPGFFSLTVPTGGGKTLSGMSFALRHAVRNKLERVIVVIPFTSIITQNAHCYQDAFGELAFSGKSNVLEHHSAIDQQKRAEEHSEQELLRQTAAENWDAPVVVTTTVQFFESQFSNHPSRCRKLHRIARSVIILDEVQTLPPRLLLPILHALKQLVRHYGCSIVLSTATPPALEARSSFAVGLKNVTPIIKDAGKLFSSPAARRVAVEWRIERPTPYEDIAAEMATHQQALTIVHLRKDARQLCELLQPEGRFHLSALMCPAHRIERIAAVDNQLKARHVCRLVSTQLIEAGVDVDFPVVYRALAGLDSLAQSAGRCDREGLRTLRAGKPAGRFIIFRAITQPPPGTLRKGVETTQKLFELQSSEPRLVGGLDLLNPDHALLYFEQFYELNHLDQNQVLREIGELNFATISEKFQMIADNGMRSIVVPWKEGRERAARYQAEPSLQTVRALQPYLVQVNKMYFDNIAGRGMIEVADNSIGLPTPLFSSDWYSDEFGLQPDPQADISPDALIL